ncbi:MAG: hypothetical protein EXR77_18770 [Myxococcales bacterium]|nr:hypothetical protein [Myxococcales bacterium]
MSRVLCFGGGLAVGGDWFVCRECDSEWRQRTAGWAEVSATGRRRTFTAEYKLKILNLSAGCVASGERGALLRREGLSASHLTEWRKARDKGALTGLSAIKRGPVPAPVDANAAEIKQLRRDNACLLAKLQRAELVIEIQKKLQNCWRSPCRPPTSQEKADAGRHAICAGRRRHRERLCRIGVPPPDDPRLPKHLAARQA